MRALIKVLLFDGSNSRYTTELSTLSMDDHKFNGACASFQQADGNIASGIRDAEVGKGYLEKKGKGHFAFPFYSLLGAVHMEQYVCPVHPTKYLVWIVWKQPVLRC